MTDSTKWYMAIGGHQIGPVDAEEIERGLRDGSLTRDSLVYTPGMTDWMPIGMVSRFTAALEREQAPPPVPAVPGRRAHEIDFVLHGTEMQFVEVALDPGESAVAEAGAMMYMSRGIQMDTVFGDGREQQRGVVDSLLGAGKRLLTGESLFMTVFTNTGSGLEHVAFAAPYAGRIVPLDLKTLGGELVCQKDSFLCAARGVSIAIAFQKRIGVGLFGGEGFIMQRLEGDGLVFAHAGGTVHAIDLTPSQVLRVDTGCIVALQPSVDYDIEFVGRIKTALFGGEGLFHATLRGPGRVWLQSLPLSRLADRIYKAAPQTGKRRVGEGSVLDHAFGLGNLIDGR